MDENGIKPGSNFHSADKRVADPSQDEYLGIKQSVFDVCMAHTNICPQEPIFLEKMPFFFIQVKLKQVLDFDKWYPLKVLIIIYQTKFELSQPTVNKGLL